MCDQATCGACTTFYKELAKNAQIALNVFGPNRLQMVKTPAGPLPTNKLVSPKSTLDKADPSSPTFITEEKDLRLDFRPASTSANTSKNATFTSKTAPPPPPVIPLGIKPNVWKPPNAKPEPTTSTVTMANPTATKLGAPAAPPVTVANKVPAPSPTWATPTVGGPLPMTTKKPEVKSEPLKPIGNSAANAAAFGALGLVLDGLAQIGQRALGERMMKEAQGMLDSIGAARLKADPKLGCVILLGFIETKFDLKVSRRYGGVTLGFGTTEASARQDAANQMNVQDVNPPYSYPAYESVWIAPSGTVNSSLPTWTGAKPETPVAMMKAGLSASDYADKISGEFNKYIAATVSAENGAAMLDVLAMDMMSRTVDQLRTLLTVNQVLSFGVVKGHPRVAALIFAKALGLTTGEIPADRLASLREKLTPLTQGDRKLVLSLLGARVPAGLMMGV